MDSIRPRVYRKTALIEYAKLRISNPVQLISLIDLSCYGTIGTVGSRKVIDRPLLPPIRLPFDKFIQGTALLRFKVSARRFEMSLVWMNCHVFVGGILFCGRGELEDVWVSFA